MWEFWNIILRYDLNKIINERDCKKRQRINAEIAQLEREISEDRYNQSKGESKMDNREELKRSLAEEKQRIKDSLENVEKMEKQLEELNKKEEQPTVSATGVILNKNIINSYFASILGDNSVKNRKNYKTSLEDEIFNINNMFISYEQAEQEALRREGQEFIRRCAMLWNKDHDWRKKTSSGQVFIYFIDNRLDISTYYNVAGGLIMFDTQVLAERCIKELNEKYNNEQLKTIFGVK